MNGHLNPTSIELKPNDRFPGGAGLYGHVPASEYHDLEGRASSSVLRTILSDSPAHAKAQMDDDTEPTRAMKLGTMLHEAILEPSRFEERYAVSTQCHAATGSGDRCGSAGKVPWRAPDGSVLWTCGRSSHQPDTDQSPLDFECPYCGATEGQVCITESGNTASPPHAARRERAEPELDTPDGAAVVQGRADVEQIKESRAEQIENMRARLRDREKARKLLFDLPGLTEVTSLWEHPGTGVLCKSRIDRVVEHDTLGVLAIDYKTTRNAAPGPHEFGRSAMKGRYDVQAAFYLEALAKTGVPCDHFVFVAQEKSPPYEVVCHAIPNSSALMDTARQDMIEALRQYKRCAQHNDWPGYVVDDEIVELEVPHWHFDE